MGEPAGRRAIVRARSLGLRRSASIPLAGPHAFGVGACCVGG